ncbi:MAG: LamG domain-containing protein, partial [Verrucomicrobiales bacterium]
MGSTQMLRHFSIILALCPLLSAAPKPILEHRFEKLSASLDAAPHTQFSPNGLTLKKPTFLQSKNPPHALTAALKKSQALTLSAWLTPAKLDQSGPARIVTISKDSSNRNITLGQDGTKLSVRLRTSGSSINGLPSLDSKATLKPERTHVAFTRSSDGRAALFLNGRISANATIKGNLNNWDDSYLLAFGNEFTKDRPWLGTIHHVAFYDRALSANDVQALFKKGTQPEPVLSEAEKTRLRSESLFVSHIEPLFSRHCLECHDSATVEGDFNLSQKLTAFADPDIIRSGHADK